MSSTVSEGLSLQKPLRGRRSALALALDDAIGGLKLWKLWTRLGWNDILQRYRRSLLGPLWLTLSMSVMVLALGVLYAELFKTPINDFLPFLCVGLLVWNYLSSFLVEAGTLFTGAESFIKQVKLPYSVYVYRSAWSKAIIFAHNFLIYFAVLAYFQLWPGAVILLAIPGFVIVTLFATFASALIGMVSARFRDIPQLLASIVQIVFFITPIMWKPELLQSRQYIATWNPFYALIEIVRAPLLGNVPDAWSYVVAGLVTIMTFAVSAAFFVKYRQRIAYWI